jgi:hypothetical protein
MMEEAYHHNSFPEQGQEGVPMTEEDQMTLMILMIDPEAAQVLDTFVVAVVEVEQELVEPTEQQLSTNTISIKSQTIGLDWTYPWCDRCNDWC